MFRVLVINNVEASSNFCRSEANRAGNLCNLSSRELDREQQWYLFRQNRRSRHLERFTISSPAVKGEKLK